MTFQRAMAAITVTALMTAACLPTAAQARPGDRYGRGGWHHHRDRGDGFGVGDAIGIAALVGAVAIVAGSLSKDRKAARASAPQGAGNGADGDLPPVDGTDYGRDMASGDRASDDRASGAPVDDGAPALAGEDAMMDACADAARQEASARGGSAEIRAMDMPRAIDAGYNIDGTVETRASWRDTSGTARRFTCTVRDGRVAEVYLARDVVAR